MGRTCLGGIGGPLREDKVSEEMQKMDSRAPLADSKKVSWQVR